MPSREAVYQAIDSERAYQDARWGDGLSGNRPATKEQAPGSRTLDEYILYIYGYATTLMQIGATEVNQQKKLDFVRKVAGLCVACMEQHGAPHRTYRKPAALGQRGTAAARG